ncbi:hypothetical protein DRN79_02020 [Methanosarcinales archaeon]|nr:MAG: hypothetical protein DRN79_02020 [Methanosarcinales archaeon]
MCLHSTSPSAELAEVHRRTRHRASGIGHQTSGIGHQTSGIIHSSGRKAEMRAASVLCVHLICARRSKGKKAKEHCA